MGVSLKEIEKRYAGVQSFLKEGCLFLSLCSIIEELTKEKVDVLEAVAYAKKMLYINKNNEMTVQDQLDFLRDYTNKQWSRELMTELPTEIPLEMYTVEKWINPRTGLTHFRRRRWDTLVDSVTVKEGCLVGYYGYSWSWR